MRGVLAVLLLIAVAGATPIKEGGILSKIFAHILHPFHHHGKPDIQHPQPTNTNSKDDSEYNFPDVDISNAEWICVNPKTKQVKVVTTMDIQQEETEHNYPSNNPWQGFYTTSQPTYQPARGKLPNQSNNLPGTEDESQPNFSSGQDYSDNLNINPSRTLKSSPKSNNKQPQNSDEDITHLIDIRRGWK